MIRIISILLFSLMSMFVFSQTFDIPTDPGKKGKTSVSMPSRSQTTGTTKPKQPAVRQHVSRTQTTETMVSTPDITTGRQVEGIERSLSIEELEELANQGDVEAHTMLGIYYFMQDDDRALPHLIAGAEAGDSRAQYFLGGVYYFGKFGTEVDKAAAASYYLKSAQQGHVPAQYGIAVCLYNGVGVELDRHAAREWMEKAAQNNDEDAKVFLETHTFD